MKNSYKRIIASFVSAAFLTTQVVAPALAQVNYTYDSKNRVATKTLPNGQAYSYGYDKLDRLTSQGFPAITGTGSSGSEYYGYFGSDVFNSFKDLRGLSTTYSVTGVGGLKKSVTAPDTGTITYQRNSYGRIDSFTDSRGVTATIGYGAGNRVSSVTYPDNTISFTYGSPGQPGAGQIVGMSDGSGSTSWGFNRSGQLTSQTQTVGSVTKTVGYTYVGPKVSTITYPSGNVVSYEYDKGNLVTIKVNSVVAISNIKHYPYGSIMSWTTAGAGNYNQTRDLFGRVIAYSFDAGSRSVGWDTSNRVTSITNPGSSAWTYGYDNLDRITSATEGGSSRTYSYDLNHNKTGEVLNGSALNYTVASNSSRLQTATVVNSQNVQETRSYSYDNAGNVLTDGLRTLTWNSAGKVATLTKDGVTTTYTYNGQGTRVKKSNSSSTTHFVYQGTDVLGEYSGTNGTGSYTETIYAEGVPVALIRDGAVYYIFPDYMDTPRTVKNSSGATVWKWASDPYGVQAPNENPGGVSLFHWNARFPGQYADDESLLYFNNARYYDAPTGRYYSSDPIGLDGGSNTYAYVKGNPLGASDPTGNWIWLAVRVGLYAWSAYEAYQDANRLYKSTRPGCKTDWGAAASLAANFVPVGAVVKSAKSAAAPIHHIFTNKNRFFVLKNGGQGPWTPKFEEFFKKAGFDMDDAINKVAIPGHKGPHPEAYHAKIYKLMKDATDGLQGQEYTDSFIATIEKIRAELLNPTSQLNKWITKRD